MRTALSAKNIRIGSTLALMHVDDSEPLLEGFLRKAAEIALYYGFTPIHAPQLEKQDIIDFKFNKLGKEKEWNVALGSVPAFRPEEKVAALRMYLRRQMDRESQPVMLCYANTDLAQKKPHRTFSLEIIGSPKSIAEAIVLKTSLVILAEAGYKDLILRINTVGDKESMIRFTKELTTFYRKHINILSPHCRQAFKTDVLSVLACDNTECQVLKEEAPKAMTYLSEISRKHFTEVLEYLEKMDIAYEVDHTLIGSKGFYSKTVFEIASTPAEEAAATTTPGGKESKKKMPSLCNPLAAGGRYDVLARRMGHRKDVPAVGISIGLEQSVLEKPCRAKTAEEPRVYFIQLGFEAKLKSLEIIEMLRNAKIPLHQSLSKDKLAAQLSMAEKMRIPYAIIMGQKETIEQTVIIRSMHNRSQDTISVHNLSEHLKTLLGLSHKKA